MDTSQGPQGTACNLNYTVCILINLLQDGISLNQEKAKKLCQQAIVSQEDFQCISLVYGYPGKS